MAVTGSYIGVLPARFMMAAQPHGVVGVDCRARDGSAVTGLWYLEALGVPAIAADVQTVRLLDGQHVHDHGVVSFVNGPAWELGTRIGQPISAAVLLLRAAHPPAWSAEISRRVTVETLPSGRSIVCADSIAYALPEDRDRNVLCVGGFAGAANMVRAAPWGIVCSDGGRGVDDAGISGLDAVAEHGIPAVAVTSRSAWIGDGMSVHRDGVLGSCNAVARALGLAAGQPASDAARLMAARS